MLEDYRTVFLKELPPDIHKDILMTAASAVLARGRTQELLYAPDMTRSRLRGIETARKELGECVKKAVGETDDPKVTEEPTHTVLTRHGEPKAVIVGIEYYRESRRMRGDPTEY